ncbi:MAG: ribonuclease D [Alphaproteobacteria bacterium]|nr:ribonuclease D [Alphaproteobacteria bacterium]
MSLIIDNTDDLSQLCERLSKQDYVTIDTEFIRERTFWPQVCLIQIASIDEIACIDPLAEQIDLTPLFNLMKNEKIMKVFHAAHQDIEIIYHLSHQVPHPIFDTQIAAMVCGFGESISYQNIVHILLDIDLDKSMRFTDWSKRPLNPKQISYAKADVSHLRNIYEKLKELLEKSDRFSWYEECILPFTLPETYDPSPYEYWKKIKINSQNPQTLAILQEISVLRENEARRLNRPRKYIMRDEVLAEIALNQVNTPEQLSGLRGISTGFENSKLGKEILEKINETLNRDPSTYPIPTKHFDLPRNAKNLSKMLKLLLMVKASEHKIADRLITNVDELDFYAAGKLKNISFLSGWKYDIFGKYAEMLKNGTISLRYNPVNFAIEIVENV